MATEEARSLLDALMGGNRNAPLPPGAAVPTHHNKRGRNDSNTGALLLPGQRGSRSCFDADIDPLYTAWGLDVYDLFVNTKSDLGANPYVVDAAAHEEFEKLPSAERERLGFDYFLFQKLQELVRSCDRIVARNKEKLAQEVHRKLAARGVQDFVEDVDVGQLEQLARGRLQVEQLESDLAQELQELDELTEQEERAKQKLEPLLETARQKKQEQEEKEKNESEDTAKESGTSQATGGEDKAEKEGAKDAEKESSAAEGDVDDKELKELQLELGQVTLRKQRVLSQTAQILSRLAPLQETTNRQERQLMYVKSDISTDKTVCEVSGNFMSARDADERIAAHYAGKQYVGWKLVRDKLKQMQQQFGRYGPPPPSSSSHSRRGVGGPPDSQGGGYGGARRPSGGGYGGRGGGYHRSGSGGHWERDRGGGGGYQDRGGPSPRGGGGPPRGHWRGR